MRTVLLIIEANQNRGKIRHRQTHHFLSKTRHIDVCYTKCDKCCKEYSISHQTAMTNCAKVAVKKSSDEFVMLMYYNICEPQPSQLYLLTYNFVFSRKMKHPLYYEGRTVGHLK